MSSGCAVCKVSGLVLWVDCAYNDEKHFDFTAGH